MEEQANQFLTRVRFLSLVRANITYLSDENQFYFDNVIQPLYHCFEGNDAKLVLELSHLVDFTLQNNVIIHEEYPQGRIVGSRTFEINCNTPPIEAAPIIELPNDCLPTIEEIIEESIAE